MVNPVSPKYQYLGEKESKIETNLKDNNNSVNKSENIKINKILISNNN